MQLRVQERPDLDTTVTTMGLATVAFTSPNRSVYITDGDRGVRLLAYWHMCASDRDFWDMVDGGKSTPMIGKWLNDP